MSEQIVLLIEIKGADEALEFPPLLVERLYVGQKEVPVAELLSALWAAARF